MTQSQRGAEHTQERGQSASRLGVHNDTAPTAPSQSQTCTVFGDLAPPHKSMLVTLRCRSWSLGTRGIRRSGAAAGLGVPLVCRRRTVILVADNSERMCSPAACDVHNPLGVQSVYSKPTSRTIAQCRQPGRGTRGPLQNARRIGRVTVQPGGQVCADCPSVASWRPWSQVSPGGSA
jgi:hypothetical protein